MKLRYSGHYAMIALFSFIGIAMIGFVLYWFCDFLAWIYYIPFKLVDSEDAFELFFRIVFAIIIGCAFSVAAIAMIEYVEKKYIAERKHEILFGINKECS